MQLFKMDLHPTQISVTWVWVLSTGHSAELEPTVDEFSKLELLSEQKLFGFSHFQMKLFLSWP